MSEPEPEHLIFFASQFDRKKAHRQIAATATFEEKVEILIQLQKISYELARMDGRESKMPWQIEKKRIDHD